MLKLYGQILYIQNILHIQNTLVFIIIICVNINNYNKLSQLFLLLNHADVFTIILN